MKVFVFHNSMNIDNIRIFVRFFKPHRTIGMIFINVDESCMAGQY